MDDYSMLRDRILSLRHTTSDLKHSNSNSNREFETETERNTPTAMPISGGRDNNSATISTYVFISLLIIFSRSHFSVCTVSILLRYNFVHTKFSVSMCFCFRFFFVCSVCLPCVREHGRARPSVCASEWQKADKIRDGSHRRQ